MHKMRKLLSLLLAVLMLTALLPARAEAATPALERRELDYVDLTIGNGFSGLPRSQAILYHSPSLFSSPSGEDDGYAWDYEVAAQELRAGLTARNAQVTVKIKVPISVYNAADGINSIANEIFTVAVAHTGNPVEGDYLRWSMGGYGGEAPAYPADSNYYNVALTYRPTYYTTAEQEAAVTAKLKEVIAGFGFTDHTTDYYKVQTVYEYIMQGCTYGCNNDSEHPDQAFCSCTSKHSAYAALIDGKAVCQGYALLLYRMLMECGVDCRLIAGVANNGLKTEGHAWNIVKLDGKWYNLDATWDDDNPALPYFLKSNNNRTFNNSHFRGDDYKTTAFNAAYPMAESDYVFGDLDDSGSLTTVDLTLLLRHLANIQPLSQAALAHADFYADGNITAADATALASLLS